MSEPRQPERCLICGAMISGPVVQGSFEGIICYDQGSRHEIVVARSAEDRERLLHDAKGFARAFKSGMERIEPPASAPSD